MFIIDFETRSEVDLLKIGGYEYARHPSTEITCMAWKLDDEPTQLWHPAFEDLTPLQGKLKRDREAPPRHLLAMGFPLMMHAGIKDGDLFEAHNVFFERCMWHFVGERLHGFPKMPEHLWRCSAGLASSYALRRKLEHAVADLGLSAQKDMEGHKLMLRMCKPRNPTKADPDTKYRQTRDELDRLFDYCKADVDAEHGLSKVLRPLRPAEVEIWQLDQEINLRGVYCDRAMAEAAVSIALDVKTVACAELQHLTNGEVEGPTKRVAMNRWLESRDYPMSSLDKEHVQAALDAGDAPGDVETALRLWKRAGKTSTKKYDAMLRRIGEDDRIRDLFLYHGASTGRWAGRGIQPQNFPRGFNSEQMEVACDAILEGDFDLLSLLYADPMGTLSDALRGCLRAPPGRELIVADFAAIEERGAFWLASDEDALDVLRSGLCIYKELAGDVFKVDNPQTLAKDSHERAVGKIGVLSLIYQSGAGTYGSMCKTQANIDLQECSTECDPKGLVTGESVVNSFRKKHWKVKKMWYKVEDAAIEAVRRGNGAIAVPVGDPVALGRIKFAVRGRFLHCQLPNGRLLSYYRPKLKQVIIEIEKNGEKKKWEKTQLSFMGIDTFTHQWTRISTYGGKLVENIVQGFCRDLLAEAMKRVARHPVYKDIVLHVHDEIVSEVDAGEGSVDEYEKIMSEVPEWASGMPIEAEGWRGVRYRK